MLLLLRTARAGMHCVRFVRPARSCAQSSMAAASGDPSVRPPACQFFTLSQAHASAFCATGSREWQYPPEDLWPQGTRTAGHIAVETYFKHCDDDACDVEIAGAKVPLQQLVFEVPAGEWHTWALRGWDALLVAL